MSILRTLGLLTLSACSVALTAQTGPESDIHPFALEGRREVELQLGILGSARSSTTTSVAGVTTSSTANGFLGALAYFHWIENTLAAIVSAGAADASAETSAESGGVTVETATVVPILFGVKCVLLRLTSEDA